MFIQKSYRILSLSLVCALGACELGGTTNDSMTSLVAAKKAAKQPVPTTTPPKLKDPVKKKPIEIGSYTELVGVKNGLAADYILTRDIDDSNSNHIWNPLGNSDTPFSGHFDGNGHTIRGIAVNSGTRTTALSLFGVNSGVIENLKLDSIGLVSTSDVAVVANENRGAISNVTVTSSWVAGAEVVGGLVGVNKGTITDSSYAGDITSIARKATNTLQDNISLISNPKHLYVGGTVGYNHAGGTIVSSISNMSTHIQTLFLHLSTAAASFSQVVGKSDPAVTYTIDPSNVAPLCVHAVLNNSGSPVAPYDSTTKGKITPSNITVDIGCEIYDAIVPSEDILDSMIFTGGEIYRGGIAADNQGVILNSVATGRIGIHINN